MIGVFYHEVTEGHEEKIYKKNFILFMFFMVENLTAEAMTEHTVYIGLGSNLGDRHEISKMQSLTCGRLRAYGRWSQALSMKQSRLLEWISPFFSMRSLR